jgi:tetratricopeptide (TPR) repeat protein
LLWCGDAGWLFFRQFYLDLIRSWLEDPDVLEALTEDDKAWVEQTAKHPASTFSGPAHSAAEKWITGIYDYKGNYCFKIVYAAIELEKGTPPGENAEFNTTVDDIMRVVEWAGLEKNVEWHRSVAIAMRDCKQYDAALQHFDEILKLDPMVGLVFVGKVKVYCAKEDWTKAIECDLIAEKIVEDNMFGAVWQKIRDEQDLASLRNIIFT